MIGRVILCRLTSENNGLDNAKGSPVGREGIQAVHPLGLLPDVIVCGNGRLPGSDTDAVILL